jgi:uncharacterized protein (DUF58 family)
VNFFTKMTLGAAAVLLAAVAAVLLFRSREAARVEALMREAVGWAAAGEAERVAELIDPDFESGGWNAAAARAEIRRRLRPGAFEKLELISIGVSVNGDEARVNLVLKWPLPEARLNLEAEQAAVVRLRKREGAWKVVGFQESGDRRW